MDGDESVTKLLLEQLATLTAEVRALKGGARPPSKTLPQLVERYLASLQWTPRSIATMTATLRPALRHFGDKPADDCTKSDWVHWRDNVRAKERTVRKGPPTPYTLNLETKRWRSVYRFGNEEGHCSTNPLAAVKLLRAKKHRHTRPEEGDLQRLLSFCSPLLQAFVLVAARTGMRAAEIRNIAWREVDFSRSRILIPWQRTKTRKERSVPVTADVVAALQRIRPEVGGRWVFENPESREPYGRTRIWTWFREAVDRAVLEAAEGDGRVVLHDWRHFFMSWASGIVPLPVAVAISGHSDLRSASRYIQITDGQMSDARDELDKSVRKGPRTTDEKRTPETPTKTESK